MEAGKGLVELTEELVTFRCELHRHGLRDLHVVLQGSGVQEQLIRETVRRRMAGFLLRLQWQLLMQLLLLLLLVEQLVEQHQIFGAEIPGR